MIYVEGGSLGWKNDGVIVVFSDWMGIVGIEERVRGIKEVEKGVGCY